MTTPAPSTTKNWSPLARVVASVLILWHVTAVLSGPIHVPWSVTGDRVQMVNRHYMQAMYLNHGYKFFAPDPGPSHLIEYDLTLADGSHKTVVFPSREENWPRLLYHRHFMLSEFMAGGAGGPPDPSWQMQPDWEKQLNSESQRTFARSYATHLLHEHQAKRVKLTLVEHAIPSPEDVSERRMALDDSRLYRRRSLGEFEEARR